LTEEATSADKWKSDLTLLLDAAGRAAEAAMSHFRRSPETWWKNGGQSPVTAADYAANDVLIDRLRSARPNYGWLSEETEDNGERLKSETLFVVDPIDGTRAFMNGLDTWCVSAAVVHQGRPVAGVLVAPALGEVLSATADGQAVLNGKPISVRSRESGSEILIASTKDTFCALPEDFRTLSRRSDHIPSLAYRLALIACGRIDATLVKPNSHDWDLAAAELILERAGGGLLRLDGQKISYNDHSISHGALCAAQENLLPDLLKAACVAFGH
jgi:myo-inositol-1(or 4)-monophosphatase